MVETNIIGNKNILDVVKYRFVWLLLSAVLIIPGIVAMVYSVITYPTHTPVRVGIDFVGGTVLQYSVDVDSNKIDLANLRSAFAKNNLDVSSMQVLSNAVGETENKNSKIKNIIAIRTAFIDEANTNKVSEITKVMKADFSNAELVSTNSIGPTLGKELFKNSLFTVALAFLGIVAYLTIRFKLDYAIIALLALFHDVLFTVGVFSILGIFFGVQVDSLFITAILTVIGFSVHDTIVIFDRIRENLRFLAKKASFDEIVNASVNQTLARSINTSLTTLITLFALYFFGGVTTKDFVLAMILGIAIGSYSSIFFASTVFAWHRDYEAKKSLKNTK